MKKIIISILSLALPLVAMAATGVTTITTLIKSANDIVKSVIPVLMMLAAAVFLWGVVRYLVATGDEEKRKKAKGYIVYGLIGMFILITFYGIIRVVAETLGVQTGGFFQDLFPPSSPTPSGLKWDEGF